MLILKGQYNQALVLTDNVEAEAQAQIIRFCNHPAFKDSTLAVMPDVHSGKGAVIGFTATMGRYVIPNVVGVDIGCGVSAWFLGKGPFNFQSLDNFIRSYIPMGVSVNDKFSFDTGEAWWDGFIRDMKEACLATEQDYQRPLLSVGSLGGGNHFIEVDVDPSGNYWLVIHTGSRNFGKKVAEFYQKKAREYTLAETGQPMLYKDLEYLPVDEASGAAYMRNMRFAQRMAHLNRAVIGGRILTFLGFNGPRKDVGYNEIESVHNFIDESNIIRKGAISAVPGIDVLIPMNMQFGTVVGVGKGTKETNYSAPHGAGRKMSRTRAKAELSMDKFSADMQGIFTTSIGQSTLDEAPDAYKDPNEVIANLNGLVDIRFIMKPVYNIKDSSGEVGWRKKKS